MTTASGLTGSEKARWISPGDVTGRAVFWWLVVTIALVFVMILVGGATRLTGSGLSITEWRPITGALPPLSGADWALEFEKYRQSPQYALLNSGMSLADFKFIYWWEWGHRQLGRFIGLFYALGLLIFCLRRRVSLWLGLILFGLGLVLALQGAIGWIMVASGLQPGMVAVAPVKLTLHLGFACLFLAGLVYAAARIAGSSPDEPIRGLGTPFLLFSLVFLQIILGGLVAGSRAGFTLNEWPLLDGAFLPPIAKLFVATPWFENFVDNPTLVQFNHRMMAYLLGILALWHAIAARRAAASPRARRAAGLCGLVLAQIALGIATVLLVVPLWAGLAHQALAMLVLAKAARHLALSRS